MSNEKKEKNLGHWQLKMLKEQVYDELPYGFVYEIINTINGRKYIGKKQCITTIKKRPLKGKKNKRCSIIETDWKTYTSSSRELNDDIIKYGKEKFIFNIIKWCNSKSELAYEEAKEQIMRDVLLTDEYYNGIINLRVGKIKKISSI